MVSVRPLSGTIQSVSGRHRCLLFFILYLSTQLAGATDAPRRFPISSLGTDDVVPTGNEWIALPAIRAVDGAIESFNVLSMRDRGLLEVTGERGGPVLQPYFVVNGEPLPFHGPSWSLMEYWVPVAQLTVEGIETSIAYCAPPGVRAAFVHMSITNRSHEKLPRADALQAAIMKHSVSDKAPGASGTIFACGTDGKTPFFADVPPGPLMKLPALGFISEDGPVFIRTYDWLRSKNYSFSYADAPYGLPGSYRLPFTTSWSVADHLNLARGRAQALKVLRASAWDGGIITEGVNPRTAVADHPGRAFATAAGYVAHAICHNFCQGERP